jgi:hypothetical protein
MTTYQLKVLIKRLWLNLQALANVLDHKHRDISQVLDKIMDGNRWNKKDLDDRYLYCFYHTFIVRFDTLEKNFTFMNSNYEPIDEPIPALSPSKATLTKNPV